MDQFKQPLEPMINLGSKNSTMLNGLWNASQIPPQEKKKKKFLKKSIQRKASMFENTNKQHICGMKNGK